MTHHYYPWIPWQDLPKVNAEVARYLPGDILGIGGESELKWSLDRRSLNIEDALSHYSDYRI